MSRRKYGTNQGKVTEDLQVFKYLADLSMMNIDRMNPTELAEYMYSYISLIVVRFYNWDEESINRTYPYYENLSKSHTGAQDLKKSLISLQNSLQYTIKSFRMLLDDHAISNKYHLTSTVGIMKNPLTDDYEAKFLMSNVEQYDHLRVRGDVCISAAVREIFVYILGQILDVYPSERIGFCKKCDKIFFSKTKALTLFCGKACGNADRQFRYRQNHGLI